MSNLFIKCSDDMAARKSDVHSFRLFVSCPKCKDDPHYWCHVKCSTTSYIDDEGFILCENLKKSQKCQKVFIQQAGFNCGKAQHGVEYASFDSLSDFLMALGTAVSSIENSTSDMSRLQGFIQRMTKNLSKNWKFL